MVVVVGDVLLVVVLLLLLEDVVGGVEGAEVMVVVDGTMVSQSLPNGKQLVNKYFFSIFFLSFFFLFSFFFPTSQPCRSYTYYI